MRHVCALLWRSLGRLGRITRRNLRFSLLLIGVSWGVMREAVFPSTWRYCSRIEFEASLSQALRGGLVLTLITAGLVGLGIVAQAIYWLGVAGMAGMTDALLATILVREISPVLVAIILLGRSGMLSAAQMGRLALGGEMNGLRSLGIDPLSAFVVPRVLALTLGSFALGVIFNVMALTMGYIICRLQSVLAEPLWTFLAHVIHAMHTRDFIQIPLKFLLSGYLLSLSSCLTGLSAGARDTLASILPRCFARGLMVILLINVGLGIALT